MQCLRCFYFPSKISQQLLGLTKLDDDELYCVTKKQSHIAYQSLYLFIFLSFQWKFLSQISQLLFEPEFSYFVYTFR